jgi:DNA-binding transcriptional regulator YiaG
METKPHAESNLIQRVAGERQAAARANNKRVRYSEALQRDIVQFVRVQKLSPEAGARRLGLSKSVVRNWLQRGVRRRPPEREPQLRRVDVIANEPRVSEREIRIVFPAGAHVVLSLGQLQQLLGGAP